MGKIYRCGIIGLGRMGAGIPAPHTTDPARKPWTHKMAYEMHPRCELMWGYDELVERSFGKFYPGIDILSVSVPAKKHLSEIYKQITFIKPRAFLLEKPMAMTIDECDQIIEVCREYSIVLAVNHQRAWELGGTVEWSGDPLENGTHAAELANRLHLNLSKKDAPYASLSINTYAGGSMVSLKAIDDIIACIEGRKEKPACDGWAGREAVRVALEVGLDLEPAVVSQSPPEGTPR